MATALITDATEIVPAAHPHWRGNLSLSPNGRACLVETGSAGRYARTERALTILWDDYPPESFAFRDGAWHRHGPSLELADMPGSEHHVALRIGSSDHYVFHQVFIDREYDSPDLPPMARTIVDLGANIGLASLFFAAKYTDARILAVEPDADNFALLAANLAPLGNRAMTLCAAAWPHDGQISLCQEDDTGTPLGSWGMQVSDRPAAPDAKVPCYNIATMLDRTGFDRVDILKVDIEGAELEIFAERSAEWLPRIDLIAIETHDRFRPGSEAAVRAALAPLFYELPSRGENLFFRTRRI